MHPNAGAEFTCPRPLGATGATWGKNRIFACFTLLHGANVSDVGRIMIRNRVRWIRHRPNSWGFLVAGLLGWHLVMLLMIVAVVVVIVVVVKAATKPKQSVQVGPGGHPLQPVQQGAPVPPDQQMQQGQPVQVGYGMDGQPIYQQRGTNVFAILALVLGLFTGILGIVFGHVARAQIRRTGESGDGLAIAGLVVGYLWLAFWVLLIVGSVFSTF